MRLIPSSFNSFLFQQKNQVASDWNTAYDWTISGISTNTTQRSQNFPLYTSKNYGGSIKVISVAFNNVDADRDSLVIAMDVSGDEQHQLFATDRFGNIWYVNAVCIGINEESVSDNTASFGVVFDVDEPMWKKYIPSEELITTLYGTGSETLNTIGNQPALPVITVTPIASGGVGFSYQGFIKIKSPIDVDILNKPYDLTDGGLDTAALVSGGQMLANGDDLRIYIDGVEVKRWFGGGGINNASTKIFVNLNLGKKTEVTLANTILITGDVPTITIEDTPENNAVLQGLVGGGNGFIAPAFVAKLCVIGDEIFVYSVIDPNTRTLTGCTRAERTTAAEAHSIGDTITFLSHEIWMYYGNALIKPYIVDDTRKPIIDLVNSTNTNPIYLDFSDISTLRTGRWRSFSNSPYTPQPGSGIYTATERGYADPASVAGAFVEWAPARWYVVWSLYDPCGITTINSATGKKYTYYNLGAPGQWWAEVVMQKSLDNNLYENIWQESEPSTRLTWEALDTHTAVSLGGTYPYIALKVWSAYDINSIASGHELDGISIELNPARVPITEMLTPVGVDVNLDTTIANAANGLSMNIQLPMTFGTSLTINTKEKTVKLYDGTNQINALIDMPIRAEWFPILPGVDNPITVTDAGTINVNFEYEDRSL